VDKKHCCEWNCALSVSVQRPQCQDFRVFKTVSTTSKVEAVNSDCYFFFLGGGGCMRWCLTLHGYMRRILLILSETFNQNWSGEAWEVQAIVLPVGSYSECKHTHEFTWLCLLNGTRYCYEYCTMLKHIHYNFMINKICLSS
jgi:hypothetical protein